ncbi:MAG: polysaccharide biosynthesis protein [Opitutales bacterium]|nr:polysaccharide biosynthesis protein [Opitutales bacterium]
MRDLLNLCIKISGYYLCLLGSFLLAYHIKYCFMLPRYIQPIMWTGALWIVSIKVAVLYAAGEFRNLFAYFRFPDLAKIIACLTTIAFGELCFRYYQVPYWIPQREVILSDLLFSILFVFFVRAFVRLIHAHFVEIDSESKTPFVTRVALIGINESTSHLIAELKERSFLKIKPIIVLDDNPKYFGKELHSVPVCGSPDLLQDLVEKYNIQGVIFTGVIPQKRFLELVERAKALRLKIFNIPSADNFLKGEVHATQLHELDVEDFLVRDPIKLDLSGIQRELEGQVVCVTGAGGSIGSELSRQISERSPKQLILIDHSEFNLFKIQQDLLRNGHACEPVLLNITHEADLKQCLTHYRPDIIFHAAAYKHVPLLEDQPLVAIKNNVVGTGLLARYACELGVKHFVLISTDKAIKPYNFMGASKRLCELMCMGMQHVSHSTQFVAVRFGNVLGSSGSVLQTFREQLARGGPLTVTHPDMTRFFMTIPEAVSLILEAFTFKKASGVIYVLDMGQPVKIVEVAKRMIELNHLTVGTDVQIVFTGPRPGEKLHEDLVFNAEQVTLTANPLIGIFKQEALGQFSSLDCLQQAQALQSDAEVLPFIRRYIPEFKQ